MRFSLNGIISSDEDARVWKFFGWRAVCPADIRAALSGNTDDEFVVEINSGGGSVYAGFEMYSLLRGASVKTRAEVQSLAGSAASVVLMGADVAACSPVAQVMIHLPSTATQGNQIVHGQSVQMLNAVTASIIAGYESKCQGKTSPEALRKLMDKETFLTAQQALDMGLIDEIIGEGQSINPMNVMNASGGLPDIEKLRAAYLEQHQPEPEPESKLQPENEHRKRVLAIAEATLKTQEIF